LIEAVRELHPKMPVLLMTGCRFENRPIKYAVLKKPIRREALIEALTMCRTVSPFRAGHGTDSSSDRTMLVSVTHKRFTLASWP
jgi:hypothetical protein